MDSDQNHRNYLPHEQRVLDEKKDLDEKISKLNEFFKKDTFAALPEEEQQYLDQQFGIMTQYSDILLKRINRFQ